LLKFTRLRGKFQKINTLRPIFISHLSKINSNSKKNMKKITLIACAFLMSASTMVFAQSQRLVMVEEFTQASCPPCAAQNPGFNTLLNANSTKLVALKYQTSWPGVDPMNAQNPTEVATRVTYYNVTGVPHGLFDGSPLTGGSYTGAPANATQAMVDAEYAVPSPFTIAINHSFNAGYDSLYINCTVTCTQAVTGTLVLHVAMMERDIYFTSAPGTNGETHFEGVMKKMIPDATGLTLPTSWTLNQTQSFNFAIAVPWYVYDLNQAAVAAFIQDNSNQSVLQAAYSTPIGGLSTANNAAITSISGASFLTCAGSVTPNVVIQNLTSTTMTSATISYALDGVQLGTQPWTGSLTQSQTATVTMPAVNIPTPGNHTLTFKVMNPNGAVDFSPIDNVKNFQVDYVAAPAAAPLVEPFTSGTYPPSGWAVQDVNNDGFTWTRSTAGLYGAGSSMMDFYDSPNGRSDNLFTKAVDMTNSPASSTLEFDVAYAQYTSENDRLKVNVSTDCGATWNTVYNKAGSTLATTAATNTFFVPTSSQWRHESVDISTYVGQSNVIFEFNGISNFGNNLYVDNINYSVLGVNDPLLNSAVSVYPNPANGSFFVKVAFDKAENMTITITNPIGETVKTMDVKNTVSGVFAFDLSKEAKGNYFVNIKTDQGSVTKRIAITQ